KQQRRLSLTQLCQSLECALHPRKGLTLDLDAGVWSEQRGERCLEAGSLGGFGLALAIAEIRRALDQRRAQLALWGLPHAESDHHRTQREQGDQVSGGDQALAQRTHAAAQV